MGRRHTNVSFRTGNNVSILVYHIFVSSRVLLYTRTSTTVVVPGIIVGTENIIGMFPDSSTTVVPNRVPWGIIQSSCICK